MPELAEVEYYRRRWDPGIGGRVVRVRTHPRARIFREVPAAAVRRALGDREFLGSEAHGKQMIFSFGGGLWLGLHLGMSGELAFQPFDGGEGGTGCDPEKHEHLVLDLDGEGAGGPGRLVFRDPRMFGKITLDRCDDDRPPLWWRDLPPGILASGFTCERLDAFLDRFPRTPLKTLLLDQRGFPGVGNWMADEICWRLGVAPRRTAPELNREQREKLRRVVRQVCRSALDVIAEDWGTPPDSWLFPHRWEDGGHCPRCGRELSRGKLRGRTTCWCEGCQG